MCRLPAAGWRSLTVRHSIRERTLPLVQEGELLKSAPDDRFRTHLQPFLQKRRVDTAELHAGIQVALSQVFGVEGGILAVVTAFDLVTEHEGGPRGSVIRA